MPAVTICSDFGAQEKKIWHYLHFSPLYLPWSDGTGCHYLSFLSVEFKSTFSLSSFTLIKRLFRSSSPSSRGSLGHLHFLPLEWYYLHYLRLLIFLPAILIPVCDLSSLAFHMMCSVYQKSRWQHAGLSHSSSVLNQSVVPCLVLTVASWPAYRFLRRQVRWSGTPISKNFPQLVVIHIKALA